MDVDKRNRRKRSKKQQNALNKQRKSNNQNEPNTSNRKAIIGNWIVAIGTVVSAIGGTPSTIFTQQTRNDFRLIGPTLEAVGIALVAETEDTVLYTVGDQIQAIGNLNVIAGVLSRNEQIESLLEKQGDSAQLVGLGLVIKTAGPLTLLETLYNTGLIIQLIGTAIEVYAIRGTVVAEDIKALGAWIKAGGAILTALATE